MLFKENKFEKKDENVMKTISKLWFLTYFNIF